MINVSPPELDRATTAFGAAMSTLGDADAEKVRGSTGAEDVDNPARKFLVGGAVLQRPKLEWGSAPLLLHVSTQPIGNPKTCSRR